MQRFSVWFRGTATVIFVGVISTIAGGGALDFIGQQQLETTNVVLKFLLDLSEQTWFIDTALLLGMFVAGLWVDWYLRNLDSSRADERKALGTQMFDLGQKLGDLKNPISRSQVMSCFIAARKLGIWAPEQRVFETHPNPYDMIFDYLAHVGALLKQGHFSEAKRYAVNSSYFRFVKTLPNADLLSPLPPRS